MPAVAAHPTTTLSPGPGGAEEEPIHLAPAAAVPAIADAPLRGNRDFWVILLGQGISSFGDAITNTALPILVLALTGSGLAMGIVGVLSTLPDLVLGLPAGAYADRWDRRTMMFVADLGRAILTAVIPISVWLGGPTLALILLVTFPLNALRVLWLAAFTAAVPGLVGRGQIARANAVFEAFFNIGWIVGPALAGLLAVAIGPGPTIAIDALTFAISAATLLLVRRPLKPQARSEPTHILADIREGIVVRSGPADAAGRDRLLGDELGHLRRPHERTHLLHHDRPRSGRRRRRPGPLGLRRRLARRLAGGSPHGVPGRRGESCSSAAS